MRRTQGKHHVITLRAEGDEQGTIHLDVLGQVDEFLAIIRFRKKQVRDPIYLDSVR